MPYSCGTSVKAPCLARVFKSPCQLLSFAPKLTAIASTEQSAQQMCKHTRSLNNCRQLLADCFGYCFSWPFFLIEFTHCIFSWLSLSIVLPFFLIEYPFSKCNRFSVKFSGNHKFGWGGGTVLALRHPVVEPRNMRATNAKAVLTVLASAPLHTQDTEIGFGALVWQPQPSFSISDRSCLVAEKSRQNASRIARQKMKTGCERHGERESERRREDGATMLGRTRKTIRCYQSEQ